MRFAQIRRAARNLATSSKKSLWALKKKESRGANSSTARPASRAACTYADAVRQREGQLLHRRRARLPDVVAGDGDSVPARQPLPAVGEDVGHDAHGGTRREDVRTAGHVLFEDVVLDGPPQLPGVGALLLGHQLVEQQENRRRGVDGHGRRDLGQRDTGEQSLHVAQGVDGHPHLAHLALHQGVVGVVAHLGGKIERHREPGLAAAQQVAVPGVRFLRRGEPGILPHGPEAAAMHRGVDTAGEGEPTRRAQLGVPVLAGGVRPVVEGPDLDAGVCAAGPLGAWVGLAHALPPLGPTWPAVQTGAAAGVSTSSVSRPSVLFGWRKAMRVPLRPTRGFSSTSRTPRSPSQRNAASMSSTA